jgi:hypothetical protein
MWTLISGQLISYVFKYLIFKLFKDKFSNKNMSLAQIAFGWLFQEHVREDFYTTGGKRFMLKRDFRNRFITQSIRIIRNVLFWIHTITALELGTWLLVLLTLFYLIYIESVNKQKTEYVFTEYFIFTMLLFLITQGCTIYGIFDLFFITRPFILFALKLYAVLTILIFGYLLYFILFNISETLSLTFRFFINKTTFILFFLFLTSIFFIAIISQENIINENFFHELTLRSFCFKYFFRDFVNIKHFIVPI